MPEYRFSEKERDMCDSLAQVWALAENENLHFKDVKDAKKPEVLSELMQKQRQISSWFYDVASKNENRQTAWEHLQEIGGACRAYLAKMQDAKRIEAENLFYVASRPNRSNSVRSDSRQIRGTSRARARSDEFISAFVDMVDQANQYGIIGSEDEIRIQKNLQLYRKVIIHKKRNLEDLPRPFRSTQDEMDAFAGEFDPSIEREFEQLENKEKEPEKGVIPPVPEGKGPIRVNEVPDDNYQRQREARKRVQAEHAREEETIRQENARLKAEAERIKAEHKKAEREKWVQHEKEEEEIRAMNERLKAQAERIKNEHLRAEREKQEQQRKAEQARQAQPQKKQLKPQEPQKAEPVHPAQREAQKQPQEEKNIPAGAESKASKEKKKGLQIEAQQNFTYHAVRAPHMQAVEGLMSRLQYSERILREIEARLEWMQMNPKSQMPYAPLMNSFQRSLAVPVFQNLMQYQNMAQYQNAPQYQAAQNGQTWGARENAGPQMAYRGPQMNYGNPMNPQMSQSAYVQRPQMNQSMQNQNPYMYGQPMQNVNSYNMYDLFGMNQQQNQMQMAYMLQNMSLIRLALTYASISIMEMYNQVKDWLSEWGKEKAMTAEQKMPSTLEPNDREKTANSLSGKRSIRFKDLEMQENIAMGKENQKKIPLTKERDPLTRQKEKGMTIH